MGIVAATFVGGGVAGCKKSCISCAVLARSSGEDGIVVQRRPPRKERERMKVGISVSKD